MHSRRSAPPVHQHKRAHRQLSTNGYFTVVGPCTVDGACVRSPNYPSNYGSSQSCTITPESPAVGWLLTATTFNTESGYDKLTVNGVQYSGATGPMGVVLSGAFTWSSDSYGTRSGWEVCAQAAPPPLPPSPPSPPSSPPMPPGYVQIADGYYMIESGSCGSGIISTTTQCNAAATALDLSDKTSSSRSVSSFYPPGCQFTSISYLYVYDSGSSGSCSSSRQCICMFTPPSSPPPPSPPPPVSCGAGTELNPGSSQCEIVCPNAQSGSEHGSGSGSESGFGAESGPGTRRRTLEDSSAAKAISDIYASFLRRHPNAADDFWQMQQELSEYDQNFRQPTSA